MSNIGKLEPTSSFMLFENAAMREDGRNGGAAAVLRTLAVPSTDGTLSMIRAIVEALLERERQLISSVNMLIEALDTDLDAINPEIIENMATILMKKYIERTKTPPDPAP